MKTPSKGQQLLAFTASEIRKNPDLWAQGWGYMGSKAIDKDPMNDAGVLQSATRGCYDLLLMKFGPQFGGNKAIGEARKLTYAHLGGVCKRDTIFSWNDEDGRTANEIAAMMDKAAGFKIHAEGRLSMLLKSIKSFVPSRELAPAAA